MELIAKEDGQPNYELALTAYEALLAAGIYCHVNQNVVKLHKLKGAENGRS